MEQQYFWELSVLGQAVRYSNLSGASSHVGLSQPQLSRIVARLEEAYKIVLLDRSARRKSGWTPVAFKLAETYQKHIRHLQSDMSLLFEGAEPTHFKIGTLEGMSSLALTFADHLLASPTIKTVELDVQDISELESLFFKGSLDFIFSFREPGRKKYQYVRRLGYQALEQKGEGHAVGVISPYEFHDRTRKKLGGEAERLLISNSLEVRKNWIASHDGAGLIPSEVRNDRKQKDGDPDVLLIGAETLSAAVWKKTSSFSV